MHTQICIDEKSEEVTVYGREKQYSGCSLYKAIKNQIEDCR